ncbi:hypothetical protein Tsp_13962, partial [Trichinella spiralis]|uniref:hypothetical protein n=1 Tax=Trichinella spiralis TaxID=6334 RepID=UPI0001EFDEC6
VYAVPSMLVIWPVGKTAAALQADVGRLSLVVEAGKQLVLSFVSSSTRQHNNTSSRNEGRGAAEQSKRNKDRRVTTAKETRVHKNERTFSFQAEEVYLAGRALLASSFFRASASIVCLQRNAVGIYF